MNNIIVKENLEYTIIKSNIFKIKCLKNQKLPENVLISDNLNFKYEASAIFWKKDIDPSSPSYKNHTPSTAYRKIKNLGPKRLIIKGNLILYHCVSLKTLPKRLVVYGYLYLNGCSSLKTLPKGLVVKGNLNISHCSSLKTLPKGLVVNGHLYLYNCTSLTHLPKGLVVHGDLDLEGCTSLTHLPKGLVVKGNLDLRNCTSLKNLSEEILIDGRIYADKELIDRTPKETLLMYIPNFRGNENFINRITKSNLTKSV